LYVFIYLIGSSTSKTEITTPRSKHITENGEWADYFQQ
jgi:hypothetical protein